jgi:hypothetical protein
MQAMWQNSQPQRILGPTGPRNPVTIKPYNSSHCTAATELYHRAAGAIFPHLSTISPSFEKVTGYRETVLAEPIPQRHRNLRCNLSESSFRSISVVTHLQNVQIFENQPVNSHVFPANRCRIAFPHRHILHLPDTFPSLVLNQTLAP